MQNFSWALFTGRSFLDVLSSVLALVVSVIALTSFLAIPLVLLIEKTDLPFRRLWSILFILPITIPSFVGSFTLILAMGPSGSLICRVFGWDSFFSIYGLLGATLGIGLFTFPYIFLTAQQTLRSIHFHIDEVALTLGSSRRALIFRLWLPLLQRSILSGIFLISLYVLSDFGTPMLMQYKTLTREIYLAYSGYFDRNYAAALSLVLMLLSLILLLTQQSLIRLSSPFKDSRQMDSNPYRVKLGMWKIPALLWCAVVSFFSLLLPVGVLIYWVIVDWGQIPFKTLIFITVQTFFLCFICAVFISLLIYPLAYWRERWRFFWKKFSLVVYLGSALPGISLALSLSFFSKKFLFCINPMWCSLWDILSSFLPVLMLSSELVWPKCPNISKKSLGVWE